MPPAAPHGARRARVSAGLAGRLQWLTQGLLALALLGLQPDLMLSWLAIGLTVLAGLKLLEARRRGERRLVGLLQLICAGLLGGLRSDLAPSLLQALVVGGALAALLALESGDEPDWSTLLRRSLVVLAAALPMAVALFVLLPRLAPFNPISDLGQRRAVTGLSDRLAPGGIASLASNGDPAARVSFSRGQPPPLQDRYWRVLVHERFDGEAWTVRDTGDDAPGPPVPDLSRDREDRQIWLAEASGVASLPWSGQGQPVGDELAVTGLGELRPPHGAPQRRLYAIGAAAPGAPDWRRAPPGPWDSQWSWGANPRLDALGRRWRAVGPPQARLAAAEAWFRSQPFRYSRQPGTLPQRQPLDWFLFERRVGFCGHYASAFTALMRAAGVPARVVSGYHGGDWVRPWGGPGYLDLRQDNAHAWSEVWLPELGWQRVDPSTWLAQEGGDGLVAHARPGPLSWLVRQWWGLDLAWGRWWMGFNRAAQEALLQRLLGNQRQLVGLVALGAVAAALGGALAALAGLRRRPMGDAPRRELERCLTLLSRHQLQPQPGETLPRFFARLAERQPALAPDLEGMLGPYQSWRYGPGPKRRRQARQLAEELRRRRRNLTRVLGR
jgi:transglutaminase-like putative cysteine protease